MVIDLHKVGIWNSIVVDLVKESMFHLFVWHLNMATPSRSDMAMAIKPGTFDILLVICDLSSSIVVKGIRGKLNKVGGMEKFDNCLFTLDALTKTAANFY